MSDFANIAPLEQLRDLLQSYIDEIDTAIDAVKANNYKTAVNAIHKVRSNLFSKKSLLTYKNRINLYMQLSVTLEMLAAYHHEYITDGADFTELNSILTQNNVQLDTGITSLLKTADIELNPKLEAILNKDSESNDVDVSNLIEELELDDSTIALLESLESEDDDGNDDVTF